MSLWDDRTLKERLRDVARAPTPLDFHPRHWETYRAGPALLVIILYPLVWIVRQVRRVLAGESRK